jgi:hypothetical protein
MPWESKFWQSKKDSFKSGFNFVVYSLVKYNKVWDLIKFSTGNLPSSNLTAKFEAFFLMPRTYNHLKNEQTPLILTELTEQKQGHDI